jgi:hypothetical protein
VCWLLRLFSARGRYETISDGVVSTNNGWVKALMAAIKWKSDGGAVKDLSGAVHGWVNWLV